MSKYRHPVELDELERRKGWDGSEPTAPATAAPLYDRYSLERNQRNLLERAEWDARAWLRHELNQRCGEMDPFERWDLEYRIWHGLDIPELARKGLEAFWDAVDELLEA